MQALLHCQQAAVSMAKVSVIRMWPHLSKRSEACLHAASFLVSGTRLMKKILLSVPERALATNTFA